VLNNQFDHSFCIFFFEESKFLWAPSMNKFMAPVRVFAQWVCLFRGSHKIVNVAPIRRMGRLIKETGKNWSKILFRLNIIYLFLC
jgi:hypothetical protein